MEAPGEPRPEESNMATIDHSVHSLLRGRKKILNYIHYGTQGSLLSFHILSISSPWNKQPLMFLNEILSNQSHLRLCEDRFRSSKVPVIGCLRLSQKTDCYGAGRNKMAHVSEKKGKHENILPFPTQAADKLGSSEVPLQVFVQTGRYILHNFNFIQRAFIFPKESWRITTPTRQTSYWQVSSKWISHTLVYKCKNTFSSHLRQQEHWNQ